MCATTGCGAAVGVGAAMLGIAGTAGGGGTATMAAGAAGAGGVEATAGAGSVGFGVESSTGSGVVVCRLDPPRTSRSLSTLRSRFLRRSLSEGRSCATTPAPVVRIATVITPRKASFNLDRSMALSTPSVSVTTEVEATPVKEELVATIVTMWIVESASDVGTVNA